MKAAYIEKTGQPDTIKIGSLPMPELGDDEVLVKVQAVAINPVDTLIRSGRYQTTLHFPFVIGRDAIGEVVKVGSAVSAFKVGDVVWTNSMGYDGRPGVTSEYAAIPATRLFHAPGSVSPTQLIAAVHSAATAAILLDDILQVKAKQSILIEGAAGHVGRKLVTLAKLKHLTVSTTSNVNDFATLRSLAADHCYDYQLPLNQLHESFDVIVDTSGQITLADNIAHLNLAGQIGLITVPKPSERQFDVRDFYTHSQSIKGFVMSHATLEQLQKTGQKLNRLFAKNLLLDDDLELLPMTEAAKGHQLLEQHQNGKKKLVLTF